MCAEEHEEAELGEVRKQTRPGLRAVGQHALHLLVRWACTPLGRGGLGPWPACLQGELAAAHAPVGKVADRKVPALDQEGSWDPSH